MSRIKILPLHEAQKIAAGEVVERPANVLKELLENALDAGASQVTIYIGAGGKQLIRIIDNGCGMSVEDARLCILPHATSKISSVDELDALETFGFRGEALASIAAVSKFKLVTRCADAAEAMQLTIDAGTINKEEIVAANKGTDITIEDLFFNVPARKKFLKTEKTEWHAIQQLIYAYALDYPAVQFTLYHNQQRILSCTSCDTILARAQQIFDHTITERLLPLSDTEQNQHAIKIEGVISDHQYGRYDRSHIYLFVNKRWVKNHKLAQAIIKGYQGVLQQGHYPCAIISITVPLHTVDINIHPRKEEVQFLHPRIVEDHIYALVKKRLENHIAERLQVPRVSHVAYQAQHNFAPQPMMQPPTIPTITLPPIATVQLEKEPFPEIAEPAPMFFEQAVEQQQHVSADQEQTFTIKGQLALTYIMLETHEGLMLIDQHAAHERVLYEQIGARMQQQELIRLLFPEQIRLSPEDYARAIEHLQVLQNLGIEAEGWSENQILITATPVYVKPHMLKDIILALVEALKHTTVAEVAHKKIQHTVQAMMACKAAIKANDVLQQEEMQSLIKQLFATPNRLTCPHGRPTSWLLSVSEIERKFKRIL